MNTLGEAISHLSKNWQPYRNIRSFSEMPGIYAIVFNGSDFPDQVLNKAFAKGKIIYIGKTESSQEARDAKTHFADGKTGSSTLRRSIGSLLKPHLSLTPIPRNSTDYAAGRTSFFKYTPEGESKLTQWMQANLGMSFYPFTRSADQLDILETGLISHFKPPLNLDKNIGNPYSDYIKQKRKKCAEEAFRNEDIAEIPRFTSKPLPPSQKKHDGRSTKKGSQLYVDIWESALPRISEGIKTALISYSDSIQFNSEVFKKAGDRQKYSFRIEFENGIAINDLGGSAVARDLNSVLCNDNKVSDLLKYKHIVFQFTTSFELKITCYS